MLWIVLTVIWFRYSVWDARADAELKFRKRPMGARIINESMIIGH